MSFCKFSGPARCRGARGRPDCSLYTLPGSRRSAAANPATRTADRRRRLAPAPQLHWETGRVATHRDPRGRCRRFFCRMESGAAGRRIIRSRVLVRPRRRWLERSRAAPADDAAECVRAAHPPREGGGAAEVRSRRPFLRRLVAAAVNPFEHEEVAALPNERLKNERLYADTPLVVITRGIPDETGSDSKTVEEERTKEQARLAALSRKGKHLIASRSGHHVQLDQPDLVITTIRELVAAAHQ